MGGRAYLGRRAPRGAYTELLIGLAERRTQFAVLPQVNRFRYHYSRAELAVGYQFLIARRATLDVGARTWLDRQVRPAPPTPEYALEWRVLPTLRVGVVW